MAERKYSKARVQGMLDANERRKVLNTVPKELQDFVVYCYNELVFTKEQICHLADLKATSVTKILKHHDALKPRNERQGLVRTRENLKAAATVSAMVYKSCARVVTNSIYKLYKDVLDPKGIRGWDHQLDHCLSVIDGYRKYDKPMSLGVLCHPANLKLVTRIANARKQHKSSLTLTQLKKRIRVFEGIHGKVKFPSHLQLDFANKTGTSTSVREGLRVLGFDPGSKNFGVFGGILYGGKTLHKVGLLETSLLRNAITSFSDDQLAEQVAKFKNEIRMLVLRVRPRVIFIERFQSRGLKGLTVELVSFMIGLIAGMCHELTEELGHAVVIHLRIASQWKNAVNRQFSLDSLYAQIPAVIHHRLDACLIALSAFPDKEVYKILADKKKQDKLLAVLRNPIKFRTIPEAYKPLYFDLRDA